MSLTQYKPVYYQLLFDLDCGFILEKEKEKEKTRKFMWHHT